MFLDTPIGGIVAIALSIGTCVLMLALARAFTREVLNEMRGLHPPTSRTNRIIGISAAVFFAGWAIAAAYYLWLVIVNWIY